MLLRGGKLIFAELKVGKNNLTESQRLWLAELDGEPIRDCVPVEALRLAGDRGNSIEVTAALSSESVMRLDPRRISVSVSTMTNEDIDRLGPPHAGS